MTSNQTTTVQRIADDLGVRPHRVHYVIKTRRIEPAGWAGHARLFGAEAVARIRAELRSIGGR